MVTPRRSEYARNKLMIMEALDSPWYSSTSLDEECLDEAAMAIARHKASLAVTAATERVDARLLHKPKEVPRDKEDRSPPRSKGALLSQGQPISIDTHLLKLERRARREQEQREQRERHHLQSSAQSGASPPHEPSSSPLEQQSPTPHLGAQTLPPARALPPPDRKTQCATPCHWSPERAQHDQMLDLASRAGVRAGILARVPQFPRTVKGTSAAPRPLTTPLARAAAATDPRFRAAPICRASPPPVIVPPSNFPVPPSSTTLPSVDAYPSVRANATGRALAAAQHGGTTPSPNFRYADRRAAHSHAKGKSDATAAGATSLVALATPAAPAAPGDSVPGVDPSTSTSKAAGGEPSSTSMATCSTPASAAALATSSATPSSCIPSPLARYTSRVIGFRGTTPISYERPKQQQQQRRPPACREALPLPPTIDRSVASGGRAPAVRGYAAAACSPCRAVVRKDEVLDLWRPERGRTASEPNKTVAVVLASPIKGAMPEVVRTLNCDLSS